MSLSSTATIKSQISSALGSEHAPTYFTTLAAFISGRISRTEFETATQSLLPQPSLLQLHNALIISLFDATAIHRRLVTPPPEAPVTSKTKRKRPDMDEGRAGNLKRWAVGIGRKERERIRTLALKGPQPPQQQPDVEVFRRPEDSEVNMERGVILKPERGEPAGSRLPLHLAQVSRAPTVQHVMDKINLVTAQFGFPVLPSKSCAAVTMLALEIYLKDIISRGISLSTSSSSTVSSISVSSQPTSYAAMVRQPQAPTLSLRAIRALVTIAPATIPGNSACIIAQGNLTEDGNTFNSGPWDDESEGLGMLGEMETRDVRWQIMALLGQRSAVREALKA